MCEADQCSVKTRNLGIRPFEKGLQEIGRGAYAWLQPDGGWGWSNAGLVVDGEESLLIDTLFDLDLTAEMLNVMRDAEPLARNIDTLVNTHSNGDHCNGNELVTGAEIIASRATAEEMPHESPEMMADLLDNAEAMGEVGHFFKQCFGAFKFRGIKRVFPTLTFEGKLDRKVGDKEVKLVQVGPCHTQGDILVHVPKDRCVYTGDVLFIEGHPIMWAGPVDNWIKACDLIMDMDVDCIVPGHGPITDKAGVRAVQHYLTYVRDETRKRFDAGLGMFEAAQDIALDDFDSWGDAERIVINVATLYREFSGDQEAANPVELFGLMASIGK